jgi:hypothetical protein
MPRTLAIHVTSQIATRFRLWRQEVSNPWLYLIVILKIYRGFVSKGSIYVLKTLQAKLASFRLSWNIHSVQVMWLLKTLPTGVIFFIVKPGKIRPNLANDRRKWSGPPIGGQRGQYAPGPRLKRTPKRGI